MYLIVTRSFPPELGGMQSLMWGLSRELSKNFIKFFDSSLERPHIRLCIPPSSGGNDLVTIRYINHTSI